MNSEPNPSLNTMTSVPESEGEAQRKLEHWGETDAVKQTHLSDLKKEEIKSSSLGWKMALWEQNDKRRYKASPGLHVRRLFVWPRAPGICPTVSQLEGVEGGGGSSSPSQESLKDKAAASNQTAREPEGAKPQCSFIYQSPTPHEEKLTSRQTGFALWGWHANPRTHSAGYVQTRRDSTHTWKGVHEPFSAWGFGCNMRGDYRSRKPASVSIIIWEANVWLCICTHARPHMTTRKWLFSLQLHQHIKPRAAWVNAQSLSSMLLHRAVVNKVEVWHSILSLQSFKVEGAAGSHFKITWIILNWL